MLPIKNRLTRKDDFQKVHRDGKFFSIKGLSLLYRPNDLQQTRIGIVVSKKSLRLATDRNRIKRLLREALRQSFSAIRPGFDIVIHSKLEKGADLKEIAPSVVSLLKKSGLLN